MNDSVNEIFPRPRQVRLRLVPAVGGPGGRKWAGLIFIALGVAMIIVDSTIVNVAIPQIIKDLGITSTDAAAVLPGAAAGAAAAVPAMAAGRNGSGPAGSG